MNVGSPILVDPKRNFAIALPSCPEFFLTQGKGIKRLFLAFGSARILSFMRTSKRVPV